MSAVAIIPARGGSMRIPGKNVRPFLGKPILAYAIEAAKSSGVFDQVWVSTEDPYIARIAFDHGAQLHPREKYMAEDHVGTQDVIRNAIGELWPGAALRPDMTCCIYPCTPILWGTDLAAARDALKAKPSRPYVMVPGIFYFGHTDAFLQGVPLEHPETAEFEPCDRWIDINTLADWEQAEQVYRRYKQ